jgi:hypothetical protein
MKTTIIIRRNGRVIIINVSALRTARRCQIKIIIAQWNTILKKGNYTVLVEDGDHFAASVTCVGSNRFGEIAPGADISPTCTNQLSSRQSIIFSSNTHTTISSQS